MTHIAITSNYLNDGAEGDRHALCKSVKLLPYRHGYNVFVR